MALTLKEIQARLLEQEAKKNRAKTGGGYSGDNSIYPFWNNPEGSSTTMRFLPDGDESNGFFWLERLIIKLPFPGVKGQPDARPTEVQVPSMDMWKANTCPVNAAIRPWWKDESLEDMARRYYRKKSFLFQGFVNENPNKDDNEPQNPIRRFIINPSVFDTVKSILLDKDLENSPTDYEHGRDFYLVKSTQGKFASYTSSKWAMKERALNDAERAAIATHGLWNLSSFMPKKPDEAHLTAIMELFEASVNEELYDVERWGQFYRPNNMRNDNANVATVADPESTTPAVTKPAVTASSIMSKISKTVDETVETPVVSSEKKTQSPEDIIAAIRARQSKK